MTPSKLAVWIGRLANSFELFGTVIVLSAALFLQFVFGELPCPLCLLQRVGLIGVAFGFLLNLRFGPRPSHYCVVLLSALFTAFVALRQVALHVIPGTGAYGSPFLGLHLYTWSFILAMLIVFGTSILLGIDRQYLVPMKRNKYWHYWVRSLFAIIVFIILANIVAVMLECGMQMCPDNPTTYQVLQ